MGLKCIIKALISINGSNHCGRICWMISECRLNKCCLRSTMRAVCVRRVSRCSMSSSQDDPRAALDVVWQTFAELISLSDCVIRASYYPSSHVVHVAAPRVHDPLEFCHVIGVKIWVNICPPSFPYCSTNEGTSSSSPISCPFISHVFYLEN